MDGYSPQDLIPDLGFRVERLVPFFHALEDAGKLEAISRVQATIEFTPTGEILTANENFLSTLGYTLGEIAVLGIVLGAVLGLRFQMWLLERG